MHELDVTISALKVDFEHNIIISALKVLFCLINTNNNEYSEDCIH